jgi:predicted phosphodiesterase
MKSLLLALTSAALLLAAAAYSRQGAPRPELDIATEAVNPFTHTNVNNRTFQIAIVSDRTGGHRARVFERAIEQVNLLQPDLVMSVGDLIEGYTTDKARLAAEWREFQGYVHRLKMPFFYVPGNHDIANPTQADVWKEKFGPAYYHFTYGGCLFVVLSSEDLPFAAKGHARIGPDQHKWLEKALGHYRDVRHTFVFVHKPMWILPDAESNGFPEVEKLLAGRKYTVFAGHVHRYQKFVRQGMNYYMLATTGGVSRMRGVDHGEFDHITWVTMKEDGPVIANLTLDGILREDLSPIPADEEGVKNFHRKPTFPLDVAVLLDDSPLSGAEVSFHGVGKEPGQPRADGVTDKEGRARLSTYEAYDGVPAGEFKVTVTQRRPRYTPEGKPGPNLLPEAYAAVSTTPLAVTLKASGREKVILRLTKEGGK